MFYGLLNFANASSIQNNTNNSVGMILNSVPIVVFIIIFYFILIKPNNKRIKEHNDLINNLKIGNKVKTLSGIKGEIIKIKDKSCIVKSGNSEIEIDKEVLEKDE